MEEHDMADEFAERARAMRDEWSPADREDELGIGNEDEEDCDD